jgi:hypothetical protein
VISYISYTSFPSYGHLHHQMTYVDIQWMSRVPPDWEPRPGISTAHPGCPTSGVEIWLNMPFAMGHIF